MNSVEADRQNALTVWQEAGFNYPSFSPTHTLGEVRDTFGALTSAELADTSIGVRLAGRVTNVRRMGKVMFWDIKDTFGGIQVFVSEKQVSNFSLLEHIQLGDIVGVHGALMRTQKDEFSVRASGIDLLSKNLEALPDSHTGLLDTEARYRRRYVDTLVNSDSRARFIERSQIVAALRQTLGGRGFMEVETPMMQSLAGGAAAKPFVTHHNSLDLDLFLRIAPELYLKRCVVGGFDRVFEIGRNFRNEGVSTRHNPEFTMLEMYQAYSDFLSMMDYAEELIRAGWRAKGGGDVLVGDAVIDIESPFARRRMDDLVAEALSVERAELTLDAMHASLRGTKPDTWGETLLAAFEEHVEQTLVQPTFVTHYPVEVSPLAKRTVGEDSMTDRFELFIGGQEIANGFSELNDPFDQEERFKNQMLLRENGNDESMMFDQDYIDALRVGLPPCGGLGIGVDRLVMLLTNTATIRDVLLFPTMRPNKNAP